MSASSRNSLQKATSSIRRWSPELNEGQYYRFQVQSGEDICGRFDGFFLRPVPPHSEADSVKYVAELRVLDRETDYFVGISSLYITKIEVIDAN